MNKKDYTKLMGLDKQAGFWSDFGNNLLSSVKAAVNPLGTVADLVRDNPSAIRDSFKNTASMFLNPIGHFTKTTPFIMKGLDQVDKRINPIRGAVEALKNPAIRKGFDFVDNQTPLNPIGILSRKVLPNPQTREGFLDHVDRYINPVRPIVDMYGGAMNKGASINLKKQAGIGDALKGAGKALASAVGKGGTKSKITYESAVDYLAKLLKRGPSGVRALKLDKASYDALPYELQRAADFSPIKSLTKGEKDAWPKIMQALKEARAGADEMNNIEKAHAAARKAGVTSYSDMLMDKIPKSYKVMVDGKQNFANIVPGNGGWTVEALSEWPATDPKSAVRAGDNVWGKIKEIL